MDQTLKRCSILFFVLQETLYSLECLGIYVLKEPLKQEEAKIHTFDEWQPIFFRNHVYNNEFTNDAAVHKVWL